MGSAYYANKWRSGKVRRPGVAATWLRKPFGLAEEGSPRRQQISGRDLPEATPDQPMMSSCRVTLKVIRSDRAACLRPAARHEGMIMMVMGAGRPGTIKIKATIAADEVRAALVAYHLSESAARSHEFYFCEQPSQLGPLPLLDGAVILRVRRHHPAGPGDVTVKLRPCQPGQLTGQWSAFRRSAHHQQRIKGEWAHDRRVLAASLVYTVPGDHLRHALDSRPHRLGQLFSVRQRRYLAE
jgi:hypothetical protein